MTAEREAMTRERELRAHVAGMQCAIDNCGLSPKEWDTSARYAMDNIGEWKRMLSEYADSLSRAAEPVGYISGVELGRLKFCLAHPEAYCTVTHIMPAKTKHDTIPLYTNPSEDAREVTDAMVERALTAAFGEAFADVSGADDESWRKRMRAAINAAMAKENGNV